MSDGVVTYLPQAHSGMVELGPKVAGQRVIVEGRAIPRLTAQDLGDSVLVILDGRLGAEIPKALSAQVCWLIANALAIGSGYSFLGAESKNMPFAPVAHAISVGGDDDT